MNSDRQIFEEQRLAVGLVYVLGGNECGRGHIGYFLINFNRIGKVKNMDQYNWDVRLYYLCKEIIDRMKLLKNYGIILIKHKYINHNDEHN